MRFFEGIPIDSRILGAIHVAPNIANSAFDSFLGPENDEGDMLDFIIDLVS